MLKNKNQTQKRQEVDPIFKEVMTFCFGRLNIPLQTQVEVSRLPRTIDALIVLRQDADLERVRQNTPFEHFRVYNLLEFKGTRDSLTLEGYHLILGRAHLYLGENKVYRSELTVTIVSARKPRKVFAELQPETLGDGRYHHNVGVPVYFVVINELTVEAKNYPLLLFAASKSKFRQFVQDAFGSGNLEYVRYAYEVQPHVTKEVLSMPAKYSLPKKNLEFIAKDIGPELLPFIDKEDILKQLSPSDLVDILKQFSPGDLVKNITLEELVRELDTEKRKQLKQILDQTDS